VFFLPSFPTPISRPSKLPYQAGWQDLKDLFRVAGNIVRADINLGADGRPKGSGTVVFETPKDAQAAISTSPRACIFFFADNVTQACTTALTGTGVPSRCARYVHPIDAHAAHNLSTCM
jgi:hypothetical protein